MTESQTNVVKGARYWATHLLATGEDMQAAGLWHNWASHHNADQREAARLIGDKIIEVFDARPNL